VQSRSEAFANPFNPLPPVFGTLANARGKIYSFDDAAAPVGQVSS